MPSPFVLTRTVTIECDDSATSNPQWNPTRRISVGGLCSRIQHVYPDDFGLTTHNIDFLSPGTIFSQTVESQLCSSSCGVLGTAKSRTFHQRTGRTPHLPTDSLQSQGKFRAAVHRKAPERGSRYCGSIGA
jgi:hypothetical protein